MIAYLKGTIEKVAENSVIIDVNGVGYTVICSARTVNEARNYSGIIRIFTVLNVREDCWTLFGFISEQEKFWFNTLTSVQGVGGKVAVAILSALSDDDIYNAFLSGDKNVFTRADGVGPKLATRIITELKEKIVGKIDVSTAVTATPKTSESGVINDVISALANLGYQKSDIMRVIFAMQPNKDVSFDALLKSVLKKLSSGV
ncbi:MAG: Holliday junction branch migration protein RuvA [Holosporaceae bacterium]|jgi:Holliday junction DNA helicase RuvA|nr:Holliday junction branch migration protein RuvA [Holosporaceae bacterium]